jgi:hypothetical protein
LKLMNYVGLAAARLVLAETLWRAALNVRVPSTILCGDCACLMLAARRRSAACVIPDGEVQPWRYSI